MLRHERDPLVATAGSHRGHQRGHLRPRDRGGPDLNVGSGGVRRAERGEFADLLQVVKQAVGSRQVRIAEGRVGGFLRRSRWWLILFALVEGIRSKRRAVVALSRRQAETRAVGVLGGNRPPFGRSDAVAAVVEIRRVAGVVVDIVRGVLQLVVEHLAGRRGDTVFGDVVARIPEDLDAVVVHVRLGARSVGRYLRGDDLDGRARGVIEPPPQSRRVVARRIQLAAQRNSVGRSGVGVDVGTRTVWDGHVTDRCAHGQQDCEAAHHFVTWNSALAAVPVRGHGGRRSGRCTPLTATTRAVIRYLPG